MEVIRLPWTRIVRGRCEGPGGNGQEGRLEEDTECRHPELCSHRLHYPGMGHRLHPKDPPDAAQDPLRSLGALATRQGARTRSNTSSAPSARQGFRRASAASRCSRLRSSTTTCAPSRRKRSAVASPMPLAPPVTRTRLPVKRVIHLQYVGQDPGSGRAWHRDQGIRRGHPGLRPRGVARTSAAQVEARAIRRLVRSEPPAQLLERGADLR